MKKHRPAYLVAVALSASLVVGTLWAQTFSMTSSVTATDLGGNTADVWYYAASNESWTTFDVDESASDGYSYQTSVLSASGVYSHHHMADCRQGHISADFYVYGSADHGSDSQYSDDLIECTG
jgi:hypothetical protein